jgi:GTP-binding protein
LTSQLSSRFSRSSRFDASSSSVSVHSVFSATSVLIPIFVLTDHCPLITVHFPLTRFSSDGTRNRLHWKVEQYAAAPIVRTAQELMPETLPSLVIVGRPNVGKSTLFNRLTGTRRSIVTNEPGITRDRIYGKAEWRGRALEIVDTGGLVPDDKALIPQEILRQAHVAIKKAALLVLVVDSQAGLTPLDEELARLLRTTGKPFVVAVNKVDAMSQESNANVFHRIGVPVFPIAAEHGTGVDDLLDSALAQVSVVASVEEDKQPDVIEVAIIGRPNVGKSTLLNRLVGEERSIVSPIPGTTMDNVDLEIARDGRAYRFVDTAGIRRKAKTTLVAEKLSVVMARRGLERCDVALLVVDGEQGVTQGDAQIASYAEESSRSVVIVINKWDLAVIAARDAASRDAATAKGKAKRAPGEKHKPENFDSGRMMFEYEKMIRAKLKFLSYAPIVFLSAKTGERADKLFPLINQCWEARRRRVSTPVLNNWLKDEVDLQRGTTPKARPVRIYYMTQAKIAPPTFLIFTNQKEPLHFSYQRFLENQLRAKFDYVGTPVRFIQRLRKREKRNTGGDSDRDE